MFDVRFKKLGPDAKLPEIAHPGEDLGIDIFSNETVRIAPGEQKLVMTGVAFEAETITLDKVTFQVGLIGKQPSGFARKRILDVKAGVLDAGWRGEIGVLLYNYGQEEQVIYPKDKIGQLIPVLVLPVQVVEVKELSDSSRKEHGWGSNHKS